MGDVVVGDRIATDENGEIIYGEDGNPVREEITENRVILEAIEPLPATISTFDDEGNAVEVANPEIVKDDAERADAQAVVDATPQAVIDAYNEENA